MELSVSKLFEFMCLFRVVSVALWSFCDTVTVTTLFFIVVGLMSSFSVEFDELLVASAAIAKAQRTGTRTQTTRNILNSFGRWTERYEKLLSFPRRRLLTAISRNTAFFNSQIDFDVFSLRVIQL